MHEYMGGPLVERLGFVNNRLKANCCLDFLCGDHLSPADVLFCNLRVSFFNDPNPEKQAFVAGLFEAIEPLNSYINKRKADFAKRLDSRPFRAY